eukprot:2261082-Prymnesium_polylepis.2
MCTTARFPVAAGSIVSGVSADGTTPPAARNRNTAAAVLGMRRGTSKPSAWARVCCKSLALQQVWGGIAVKRRATR